MYWPSNGIVFFVISMITFLLRKNINHKIIFLFYIIFVSSVFSPIIFFIISPSSGLIYHFNNSILLCVFLYTSILICIFLKNIFNGNRLLYFFLTLSLSFNIYHNFSLSINNQKFLDKDNRIMEFNIIQNNLKKDFKDKFNTKGLLTFDTNFMIWAILNDFKFINIMNHMWTPKNYKMMDEDLIKNLKFLNLKQSNLEILFQNNFKGWRYFNKNIGEIFGYRYQANSLLVSDFDDFGNDKINNFIINSPPNLNQQIAITTKEKKRIINEFNKNMNFEYRNPEIIIINLDKEFLNNYLVDMNTYCQKYKGNFYSVYYLGDKNNCE